MKKPINSLQAGRAIASLAVAAHHSGIAIADFIGGMPAVLQRILDYGYLGVDFFFVLSGFIIYYSNRDLPDRRGWSRRYAANRFTRIFIPYLPIGMSMAFAYTVLPDAAGAQRGWAWFPTLTLFPAGSPALSVAWTLQHEVFFYGLLWLFLRTRQILPGYLLWTASIIAANLFAATPSIPLEFINLEFLFGIFAARCLANDSFQNGTLWIIVGFIAIITFFLIGKRDTSFIFGLGIACLLVPLVRAECAGRLEVGAPFLLLGAASYAIYLVHCPLISLSIRLSALIGAGWLMTLIALLVVSTIAGVAYHLLIETPAIRLARGLLDQGRAGLETPTRLHVE